jgi:hypothetical protein
MSDAQSPKDAPVPAPAPAIGSGGWFTEAQKSKLVAILIFFLGALALLILQWLRKEAGLNQETPTPQPPALVAEKPAPQALVEDDIPLYFCGDRPRLQDNFRAKRFPTDQITWSIDPSGYVGRLKPEDIIQAFEIAWQTWRRWLNIEPVNVGSWVAGADGKQVWKPNEAKALVRSRFGVLMREDGRPDGPRNILAYSELSDGTLVAKEQLYDNAENWGIAENPPASMIEMVRVAAHEIGHALGLEHDHVGTGALMEPTYSRNVRFPTSRDASRMYQLGYKPRDDKANPSKPILISVTADAEKLIDALRQAGYAIEIKK